MRTSKITADDGLGLPVMHAGGSVTYRVTTADGRWVGWVGDGRAWKGYRYGGRRWWAAWRENGDRAARWNSGGLGYPSRSAALDALVRVVEAGS